MGNWKKAEDDKGFFYYINEETSKKQWDHPKFLDLKQSVDDCNYVTYPLYRLALKFRVLQRSLFMEEVPLSIITAIFERHRLGNNESSLTLETCDLEAVLTEIFFAANKKNHTNIDIDFASEIVVNFFLMYTIGQSKSIIDSSRHQSHALLKETKKDTIRFREGNIQVFATKMLLGILSNCSLLDIYKFLFSLCADHNNCITRLRLQGLLLKIFELIRYLHEDVAVGQNINSAIESCFRSSPGLVGITESSFIVWLETNPPLLSWLSLMTKLRSAETVMHSVKCTSCKTRPLMGLRYRCIKCSRYTQCQRCFLTGRISHSHKLSHPVREYTAVNSSKERSGDFARKMCSLFCPMSAESKFSVIRPTRCLTNEHIKRHQSIDRVCEVEPLSSPETQLQGVIRQLESQNRELQQMLIFGNYSDKEMRNYLEEYRIFMSENIRKLKILKCQINTSSDSEIINYKNPQLRNMPHIQSTPMVQFSNIDRCKSIARENSLSPVTIMTEINDTFKKDYNYLNLENGTAQFRMRQSNPISDSREDHSSSSRESRTSLHQSITTDQKGSVYVTKSPVKLLHNNLDEALARLQQILANNFSLEDSLNPMDNTNLKYAVTEVEGMLTSIIDNVESSRSSSALPGRTKT